MAYPLALGLIAIQFIKHIIGAINFYFLQFYENPI